MTFDQYNTIPILYNSLNNDLLTNLYVINVVLLICLQGHPEFMAMEDFETEFNLSFLTDSTITTSNFAIAIISLRRCRSHLTYSYHNDHHPHYIFNPPFIFSFSSPRVLFQLGYSILLSFFSFSSVIQSISQSFIQFCMISLSTWLLEPPQNLSFSRSYLC